MRDMVCSIAGGRIEGKIAIDLFQDEDNFGEADLPVAMLPGTGEITLLQMDGDLTKSEIAEILEMSKKACEKIAKLQRKALIDKYKKEGVGDNNE